MKIKQIESIKDFGIFSDYQVKRAKDFGAHNVIFGWNYSGKTTLSRIFRVLEKQQPHPDFKDSKFKLVLDDGSEITNKDVLSNALKIRVFNSDYIRENLSWEQPVEGIPPILVLGEFKIDLQKKLDDLKESREKLTADHDQLQKDSKKTEQELEDLLTTGARSIAKELSITRGFDKRHLRNLLEDSGITTWDLSSEELKNETAIVQLTGGLEPLNELQLDIDKNLLDNIRALLKKAVSPTRTMERLKRDLSIENWVRDGHRLHKDKIKCEFCQSDLPEGLMDELDAHFSKEYESFRDVVNEHLDKLERQELSPEFRSKNDLYPEFQEEYMQQISLLKEKIEEYNIRIGDLVKNVKEKILKLSDPLVLKSPVTLDESGIESLVEEINRITSLHNKKTRDFEKNQQDSVERLKRYYASEFYKNQRYAEVKRKIEADKGSLIGIGKDIKVKTDKIEDIESRVSESDKGAKIMNDYIKRFFGQNTPIYIKVINNRFHVFRGEKEAKNLSEGEKTAISFSYFLSRLNDKETSGFLNETIVYIDDPVSSLDSNHLYNTYALIATCLKDKCGQLFVSTHNYELFNMLKDEFKKRNPKKCKFDERLNYKCDTNLYQIDRSLNNAWIDNLDCLLCNFKSEYQYLFYQIYQFTQIQGSDSTDDYKIYTLPNILRRFLEIYLGFTFPSSKQILKNSLGKLIVSEEDRKFVQKIANELSHSENTERALRLYTAEEIKRAIQITFAAFEQNVERKRYIEELKESVGIKSDI